MIHSSDSSDSEESVPNRICTTLVEVSEMISKMVQIELEMISISNKNPEYNLKEFKRLSKQSFQKLELIDNDLSENEAKLAQTLKQKLNEIYKRGKKAVSMQKSKLQEEKKEEQKKENYLKHHQETEKRIRLVSDCHSFDREWLKKYIKEKTDGMYFYWHNHEDFKLVKCPQIGCYKFISLDDISRLLTEQEEQEAFQELQYWMEKHQNKPPVTFKNCAICRSLQLGQEGCQTHKLCDGCYEVNEKNYLKCPAYGCKWRDKNYKGP